MNNNHQEHLLRTILENSPVGIYLADSGKRVVYANRKIREWLGADSPEELINGSPSNWYANQDDWRNIQVKIAETGKIEGYESYWRDKEGETFLVSEHIIAVDLPDGSGKCYESIVEKSTVPIPAKTDLEKEIKERTAQLEAANKELEAFSYSVSHDLQTPIRHIYSFGKLLEKRAGENLDEKSRLFLQNILDSSQSMSDLIEGLLSFSRIGRSEIKKIPVELNHLIEAVRDDYTLETANRDIEWKTGKNHTLFADVRLIRLVMSNLVGNALKYTVKNEKTVIEIGSYLKDKQVVVFVKDNGVGFNMKYAGRLFGVFQRLHSQAQFEGTGIGLSNVKRIITRHGGQVWAEGEEGKGATFYFSLPVA